MNMKWLLLGLLSGVALAKVNVVTSTTDIAWAAKEIGGEHVAVKALLEGSENPHYVDAVPEYIRLASNADLVCQIGLELEVGWMPKVLAKSGNADVQPGGKGFCEVGKGVAILDKVNGPVDRSMGDVHPAGNPHFWISPPHFKQAGSVVRDYLIQVDPTHTADYLKNYEAFSGKLDALVENNKKKLAPFAERLKNTSMMEYHKEFTYFIDTYGLKSFGSLEEKPGVPPSAGRLAQVAIAAKAAGIGFVIAADTAPKQTLKRFTEMSGIPVVVLPMSLKPDGGFSDYVKFENYLVDQVVNALKSEKVAETQKPGKSA